MNYRQIILFVVSLSLAPLVSSDEDSGCFYSSEKDDGDLVIFDHCGRVDDTGFTLTPEHRENIRFGDDDLACLVFSKDNAFWVHKNGNSARTLYYDTWCDRFEGGLAIGKVEGREVYINANLEVVLNPGFDSLSHFYYGFAVVCNGPFYYEQLGEHSFRKGGKCGLINQQGEVVLEPAYPAEERVAFREYRDSHNECPVPPIREEVSAVCHAKRHARNTDYDEGWIVHSVAFDGEQWTIEFLETSRPKYRVTMNIGAAKAELRTIATSEVQAEPIDP
ncbi:MAG: WG repeat-containing protein [Woeseiaceae bacterium]